MPRVQTVLGPVDPDALGFTLTHEHLVCHPPKFVVDADPDLEVSDRDKGEAELENYRQAGGGTLVEATAIDYGRDVPAVVSIAQKVPVHIVMVTGFNKGRFYPEWVRRASLDELADLMIREITQGMDHTTYRAGVIKVGSWYNVITPDEEKVSRAAARAQKATGAPIWVHTESGTMGLEQLDILESEGADLSKVVVGHSDRNADLYYHKKLAQRGAYVGYDGPSKVKYYPDSVRVELIKEMISAGYLKQLLISGDMARKSYLQAYGGGPGLKYIPTKFVARLLDEGITQDQVDEIFRRNPARWLAF